MVTKHRTRRRSPFAAPKKRKPPLPHRKIGNNGDWIADGIDFSSPKPCPALNPPTHAEILLGQSCADPNTRREQGMEIFRASKGALRRLDSRMLTVCAERGEMMRRNGCIPPPPQFELVDYPGIFLK